MSPMQVFATIPALRATLMTAVLVGCGGCPFGADDGPGGVEMGGVFQRDPSCELDGELTLELGDGSDGFTPLGVGQGPRVHHGPQGGSHLWLGVRIGNLALDRYDLVRVTSEMFDASQCPSDDGPCESPAEWHFGQWVLGDVAPLNPVDAHTVEQDKLTAVFDAYGQSIVMRVSVEDPCGQVGFAERRFSVGD